MKLSSITIIAILTILFACQCQAGPIAFYTDDPDVVPNETITIYLMAGDGVEVIGLGLDVIDDITPTGTASHPVLNPNFDVGYEGLPSNGSVLYVMATISSIPAVPVTGTLWSFDYQVPDVSSPTTITIAADPVGSEEPHVSVLIDGESSENYVPDALVLHVTPPVVNYTLTTAVIGEHGTLLPTSGSYEDGTEVALTATPQTGYQVKSWSGTDNDASVETTNTVTMTGNKTVTVEFEEIPPSYNLTASVVGGHGMISPESGIYDEDEQVTLTATPEAGYRVKAWSGTDNDASVELTNTVTMTQNRDVSVEFELIPTTMVALTTQVDGGHGSLLPLPGSYEEGTLVTLTATPDSGYQVKAWTGTDDDTSVELTNTVTMTQDKTVTVAFASPLLTDKCLVKAGNRENTDSLQISGKCLAEVSEIDNAVSILIDIRSDSGFSFSADPIPFDTSDMSGDKFRYTRQIPAGEPGGITSFLFDLTRQTFSLKIDKISLTGLASPVSVELNIGEYSGIATIGEDLINGGHKDIPITLMKSYANELRVSRAKYKQGLKAGRDFLLVNGEIAVENTSVDLFETDIEIGWGEYSIVLPAGTMIQKPNKHVFVYKKQGKNDPIGKAIFDLDRCKFNILIRNTTIPPQASPAEFRITFNGFDEFVDVE